MMVNCYAHRMTRKAPTLKHIKAQILGNNITIRQATPDDLFAMTSLLSELFKLEKDFSPNLACQREGLATLMRDRNSTILVALVKNNIIGMCTLQTLVSTAEGGVVGMVEDLVVSEAYRQQNVGTQLLQTMQAIAEKQGLLRLQLFTEQNRITDAFFTSNQWQATQLIVKRKILK